MRQIRRQELRRDDPLVDGAFSTLARTHFKKDRIVQYPDDTIQSLTDAERIHREARRVLRRLCETGAVLAVAKDMEKAVVVRETKGGDSTRTAVVDVAVAQVMALNDWICCTNSGRVSRYHITAGGRVMLSRLLAHHENRMRLQREHGTAGAQKAQLASSDHWGERDVDDPETGKRRRLRYNMAESPLTALARRKDRDGQPFLNDAMVRAGERLREDFELAQMGPRVTQNWERFLTGGGRGSFAPDSGIGVGPSAARARVAMALTFLGPGLSDVALRCCCYLDGLENAEKRMGWSARSGKIVLRIALQRLADHYGGQCERSRMIS
ncbi:DUF6456 domain-containing protein [Pontibaca salina]